MRGERVLGLELGATHWRAVHLEMRFGRTRLIEAAQGTIRATDGRAAAAAEAMTVATEALSAEPGTALGVVAARPLVHIKRIVLPRMSRRDMIEAVRSQAASLLPMGRAPMRIDADAPARSAPWKGEVETWIAALPAEVVDAVARTAEERGLRLASLDGVAAAVRLLAPRQTRGAVLLQPDGIEWIEFAERGLRASWYFPIARNGDAKGNGAGGAISLPTELRQAADRLSRVVLLGADHLAGEVFDSGPDPNGQVTRARSRRRIRGLDRSELVPAGGAALLATGANPTFDLRPDRLRDASERRRRRRTWVLLVAAILAAAFQALGWHRSLRNEVRALDRAVEESAPAAEEVLEMREGALAALRWAERFARFEQRQPRWTAVLAELARVMSTRAHLTELHERDGVVVVRGFASNASGLLSDLRGSPLFASARFAGPVTREDTPAGERDRFAIELIVGRGGER